MDVAARRILERLQAGFGRARRRRLHAIAAAARDQPVVPGRPPEPRPEAICDSHVQIAGDGLAHGTIENKVTARRLLPSPADHAAWDGKAVGGQCAPCRIGSRFLQRQLEAYLRWGDPAVLRDCADVGWEMEEGSICGLGMVAAKPLAHAREHFAAAFEPRSPSCDGPQSD